MFSSTPSDPAYTNYSAVPQDPPHLRINSDKVGDDFMVMTGGWFCGLSQREMMLVVAP